MKQWDVHLRYSHTEPVDVQRLNNRLHPERSGVSDAEVWLVLRQKAETLTDAMITAIARVEELVELPLEAVWAEEAVILAVV